MHSRAKGTADPYWLEPGGTGRTLGRSDIQTDGRKFPPLFCRTSSPSGPLPKKDEEEEENEKKEKGKEDEKKMEEGPKKERLKVPDCANSS